eukprot:TRINITY_DN3863_c0_g1_i2.p3 TRINITY_DN3863_c0_g1~~TRINITY_DN3863_c0_g1_i2.p3  ORF type:complete len:137 (-),score=25.01 TRINITY_DN3863_c0_g1_i2:1298-1708(-)
MQSTATKATATAACEDASGAESEDDDVVVVGSNSSNHSHSDKDGAEEDTEDSPDKVNRDLDAATMLRMQIPRQHKIWSQLQGRRGRGDKSDDEGRNRDSVGPYPDGDFQVLIENPCKDDTGLCKIRPARARFARGW